MSFDRAALAAAIAAHGPVARVVVIAAAGSTPRGTGTAMLVWEGGQSGTIGGGTLEWEAAAMARARLAEARAATVTLPLGPALGQCCGGSVTLAIEPFTTAPPEAAAYSRALTDTPQPLSARRAMAQARNGQAPGLTWADGWLTEAMAAPRVPLWIWGAGHVGRAMVDVLAPTEAFTITWVDTHASRFPQTPLPTLAHPAPQTLAPKAPPEAHHLILTYSHELDYALCAALLNQPTASIGLIGSATKWARFRRRLIAAGHSDTHRITCPIGDPALGKTPQAIAISTAARLLSALRHAASDHGRAGTDKGTVTR